MKVNQPFGRLPPPPARGPGGPQGPGRPFPGGPGGAMGPGGGPQRPGDPQRGPMGAGGPQRPGDPQGPRNQDGFDDQRVGRPGQDGPRIPRGELTPREDAQLRGDVDELQGAMRSAQADGTVGADEASQLRELQQRLRDDTFAFATNDERLPKLR